MFLVNLFFKAYSIYICMYIWKLDKSIRHNLRDHQTDFNIYYVRIYVCIYFYIFFLGWGGGGEGEFLRKANILSKMSDCLNLVFTCIVWVYWILNELCRYVSV